MHERRENGVYYLIGCSSHRTTREILRSWSRDQYQSCPWLLWVFVNKREHSLTTENWRPIVSLILHYFLERKKSFSDDPKIIYDCLVHGSWLSCPAFSIFAHERSVSVTSLISANIRWWREGSVSLVHCVDRSWCSSTSEMIRWASWDHRPSAYRLSRMFIHKGGQSWWIEWPIPMVTVVIGDVRLS